MEIRYYEGVNLIHLGWKYATKPHGKFTTLSQSLVKSSIQLTGKLAKCYKVLKPNDMGNN